MTGKDILDYLTEYSKEDYVPMHMPGAKRNDRLMSMDNPYGLDITEIDGFDNMHNPTGIIKDAFDRCAKVFGADESLFLINGSSAGVMSAICGATGHGDTVIVARNSHISVYNAMYLNKLNPVYVYPKVGSFGYCQAVTATQIEDALKNNSGVKAVIITSPTYEGIVSDILAIAEVVHKYGAVLIVDEAHGAHLKFHSTFPKSANECGADVVIQSIHKTLPSLTQTALLHMNGDLIDRERVRMYWNMYQTTSPSYILMGSIDRCVRLIEEQGQQLFNEYVERLLELRKQISCLKNIRLCPVDDISKIVLGVNDGAMLYDRLLKEYHIQCEMTSASYVVAMTSIGDTKQYYERFIDALRKLDVQCECYSEGSKTLEYSQHVTECSIYDAVNEAKEYVSMSKAAGRIAGCKVCLYPPGIPLVVEGEIITEEDIRIIRDALQRGIEVIGIKEEEMLCLR